MAKYQITRFVNYEVYDEVEADTLEEAKEYMKNKRLRDYPDRSDPGEDYFVGSECWKVYDEEYDEWEVVE